MDRSRSSNSHKVKKPPLASSSNTTSVSDTTLPTTADTAVDPCHTSKAPRKQLISYHHPIEQGTSVTSPNSTRKRSRPAPKIYTPRKLLRSEPADSPQTTSKTRRDKRHLTTSELSAHHPSKKAKKGKESIVQGSVMSGNKRGKLGKKYMSSHDDDVPLDVETKGKAKANSSNKASSERRSGRAGSRASKKQADPETLDDAVEHQEDQEAIARFASLFDRGSFHNHPDDEDGEDDSHDEHDDIKELEHSDDEEDGDDDEDDDEDDVEHYEHHEDEDEFDEEDDDEDDMKEEFEFTGPDGDMPADMRRFLASMRGMGGVRDMMSDHSKRMKSILINLRDRSDPSMQLVALQGLAELLSVSTEDTLAGIFNAEPYVKELVNILKGGDTMIDMEGMDDATLAAIMASGGGDFGAGNPEMMLLACRCISNLIEAMPSAMGSVVYGGAVPVLCQKLKEIQYIDLAEQALSTLEKISAEFPNSIVREGGLGASLMYLDFFNTHVQRTALTIAANCCRNISSEAFGQVQEIVPTLNNTINYSDQRVVEQTCLCWLRLARSFKHQRESLETIVSEDLLKTIIGLIAGTGSSNAVGPQIFSSLMQFISIIAKSSPSLRVKLLEAHIIDILFHILTGSVAPPTEDIQSTIVVSSIAPKSNTSIYETLDILVGLLPNLPTDGIFDLKKPTPMTSLPEEQPIARRTRSSNSRRNSEDSLPSAEPDESTTLWTKQPHVAQRVCQIMVPTLFEVYSSTVNLQIRQLVLTTLLKIMHFTDKDVLEHVLASIPLASFIPGVLAQQEHSTLLISALQLAEILLIKLPHQYVTHFESEGVIHEIRRLATASEDDQGSSTSTQDVPKPETSGTESTQEEPSSTDRLESELEAIFADRALDASFTSSMRLFDRLRRNPAVSNGIGGQDKGLGTKDTRHWIIITAKSFLDAYAEASNLDDGSQSVDTDHLKVVAQCLQGTSQAMTPKQALQEITARYKSGAGVSSFELMSTGLIDGLLHYLSNTGPEDATLNYHHRMFMHVFMGGPDPDTEEHDLQPTTTEDTTNVFHVLVSKLQESLNRKESFEVVTPYQGPVDDMRRNPTGMLAKQIRLKLTGDSTDIPRAYQNLVVSVHAVATFKAIDEYLRPRISRTSLEPRDKLRTGASRRRKHKTSPLASGENTPSASDSNRTPTSELKDGLTDVASDSTIRQGAMDDNDVSREIGTETPVSERTVEMEIAEDSPDAEVKAKVKKDQPTVGSSSETKPKPPSYSAALGMSDKDWHIQFYIDDIPVTLDTTIYGAIHQYEKRMGNNRNVWSTTYPIKYKKVTGETASPDTKHETNDINQSSFELTDLSSTSIEESCGKILLLLRALNNINFRWADLYGTDSATRRSKSCIKTLFKHDFHNRKLTAKMNRQLDEPLIVASSCLPEWCYDLAKGFPFLFPFETRYLFLQSTSFGYSRSMNRWMNQQTRSSSDNRRDDSQPFLGRIDRQKVRISRSRMLESAVKVLELYGKSQSVLEVEYFDEEGTGLGPTLEFYAIISKQFCKKSLHMWRDDDSNQESPYVSTKLGLFPRPMSDAMAKSEKGRKIINLFNVLGQFVSKAMLDSRNIDIPFNPAFLSKVLGQSSMNDITAVMAVDPTLGNSLLDLQSFVTQKHAMYASQQAPDDETLANIEVRGANISDFCLDFTVPGDSDMELKPNGAQIPVTIHNVDEYLELVVDAVTGTSIARQVEAFRNGFNGVFPVNDLQLFHPEELVSFFGKTEEDWSYETLADAVKADHGYNMESKAIKYLLEIMTGFSEDERREFLQFITGSPKLPIGGWKNLSPMFTIVRKPHEPPLTSDDYLPSVMTCVNYLKLPDYSSKEAMHKRLLTSVTEGKGSFLLS